MSNDGAKNSRTPSSTSPLQGYQLQFALQSLAQLPNHLLSLKSLGESKFKLNQFEEAVDYFNRSLALSPHDLEVLSQLSEAYVRLDRIEESVRCYERILHLYPGHLEALINLGISLQWLGRISESRDVFAQAIEKAPRNGRCYLGFAESENFQSGNPLIAVMDHLVEEGSLPEADRVHLHFALGKAFHDLGEEEHSFAHLLKGNTLRRRSLFYDESATLAYFQRIQEVFSRELLQSYRGLGHPSGVPIFILGMPRSGSTLVEQILASHPKVWGAGEITNFQDALAALALRSWPPADPPALGSAFPEIVQEFRAEHLTSLGEQYLQSIQKLPLAKPVSFITNKLLSNFDYAGLIYLVFPQARLIHIKRDPVDTCLSCFSKPFTENQPFLHDLGELGRYYRAYEGLMQHWQTVLPPDVLLEVEYEALVTDFEPQVRRMLDFCHLEWDEGCRNFHQTPRTVRTASAQQVRRRLYQSSIRSWRPPQEIIDQLGF